MQYIAQLNGINFRPRECRDEAASLELNSVLSLEREPENAFDTNAIKVMSKGFHVGYVERGVASFISPLIDEGMQFSCKIDRFEPSFGKRAPTIILMLREIDEDGSAENP
jgi:hypothetical protein